MFICDKCKKEFNYKSLLTRHLNNKNGCGVITNIIANEENKQNKGIKIYTKINNLKAKIRKLDIIDADNQCKYCKKTYSNKSNLKTHIQNKCKNKIGILNSIS